MMPFLYCEIALPDTHQPIELSTSRPGQRRNRVAQGDRRRGFGRDRQEAELRRGVVLAPGRLKTVEITLRQMAETRVASHSRKPREQSNEASLLHIQVFEQLSLLVNHRPRSTINVTTALPPRAPRRPGHASNARGRRRKEFRPLPAGDRGRSIAARSLDPRNTC